jgi:hypothetical protein
LDVKSIPVSPAFPNGGYVVAGYTSNTSQGNQGDKDMLFIILDRYGNIVGKEKKFGSSGDDVARHVDVLSNGSGFVLTGYTTSGGQRHAYIVRLNAAGTDTLWTWTSNIAGSTAEEALSLHVDSVTNIYTGVGYQTYNSTQYGWIFDIDQNGKYDIAAWDTLSIRSKNVAFTDIGFINPPYICLFGGATSQPIPGLPPNDKSVIFVAKKQLNSYTVYNNTHAIAILRKPNDYARQMIILPGNKAAFLGSMDTINANTHSVHIEILNNPASPAGDTTANWYYFDISGGNGSLDAIKMKYNTGENSFTILATLTSTSGNTSIVLIKIDGTNGNELWRHTFGENQNYGAGGLDITPDGGYIITGNNNTGGYNQSVLIIKTNKDGFIE